MSVDYKQLSKTLAHALRHAPWVYELELNEQGWCDTAAVLSALHERRKWRSITFADLEHIIATQQKRRYELRGGESGQIRALYGHSIHAKIVKEAAEPPEILYHGTAPETAMLIRQEGLKPMRRQYVHLSADVETAQQVGSRKAGQPVLLQIQAQAAYQQGILFYRGNELVWLADTVPAKYIV
jgi:putative RNA 2'-phosphotransferase